MARWPSSHDPYAGRKKAAHWKKAHFAAGGKVSSGSQHDFRPIGDGKSTRHPSGPGDTFEGRHHAERTLPSYHHTGRKKTPADYGTRTPKAEKPIP